MNIKNLFGIGQAMRLLTGKTKHYGYREGRKDTQNLADLERSLKTTLDQRDEKMNGMIEAAKKEIAAVGAMSQKTIDELEAFAKKSTEFQETLNALTTDIAEMKAKGMRGTNDEAFKTPGEQLVECDEFKALAQKGRGTVVFQLKAVTNITSTTTGTGAAGALIVNDRLPGIQIPGQRTLTIRDLLLPGRTNSNMIEYVQETGFQNMAATVAEGGLKPQSDLAFALKQSPVRTIAHWVRASKQILADAPQLQTYIDTRMTYGLKLVEENQILAGDGTGQNLLGLIPQATAFDNTKRKTGDTQIDTIRRAILQVRIAEFAASGIVLHPTDWADIELLKDSTGQYLWVNVTVGGVPQLWRLPVLETTAMPEGHFLVGAFNIGAQVFDREDANVQVSTEDQDNFVKNMVTIRVEERVAFVVYRPESFIYGAFAAP